MKAERGYVIKTRGRFTLSRPVCQSPPAFQAWIWFVLALHVKCLEPDETHILSSSWGQIVIPANGSFGLQYFSLFWGMRGRVWERERVRETDKLRASTLEEPHSTSLTMECKGVCVLLGLLLLVNCSLQQTAPKRKLVKKGRCQKYDSSQPVWISYLHFLNFLYTAWFLHHVLKSPRKNHPNFL